MKHALIIGTVSLTISCNLTPELTEPPSTSTMDRSGDTLRGPIFSVPVTLDRVMIFTSGSGTVTGTATVEIATTTGVVLGSSVLPGSSMTGRGTWRTFHFAPVYLVAGTRYRIQVKRSDEPDYYNNYMHWGASDGLIDVYPEGETSISGTHPPYDMAFKTYSGGYVDQQQTTHRYFWGIGQYVMWQEFVPEQIVVIHP